MFNNAYKTFSFVSYPSQENTKKKGAETFGYPVCPEIESYIDAVSTEADKVRRSLMFTKNPLMGKCVEEIEIIEEE